MTKILELDNETHEADNLDCPKCWPGYPIPHECGGLLHATFGDENRNGDYWLYKECDKCGEHE